MKLAWAASPDYGFDLMIPSDSTHIKSLLVVLSNGRRLAWSSSLIEFWSVLTRDSKAGAQKPRGAIIATIDTEESLIHGQHTLIITKGGRELYIMVIGFGNLRIFQLCRFESLFLGTPGNRIGCCAFELTIERKSGVLYPFSLGPFSFPQNLDTWIIR
jgi:hypothetical protein